MSSNHQHSASASDRRDHYAELTQRVIAALEAGTPPWQVPWDRNRAAGPSMPRNAVTGVRYRGVNVITLGMSPLAFESADPRWATYKQAADRGWQVKKGARGTTAYFFKRLEVEDRDAGAGEEGTKRIPLLRAFTLFHASQIEGAPLYVPPTVAEAPWRAPDAVEVIMARSGAAVRVGGDRAFYSPVTDHIQMPPRDAFPDAERWSGTILHEGCHNAASWIMPHVRWQHLAGHRQDVRRIGITQAVLRTTVRHSSALPTWRSEEYGSQYDCADNSQAA